MKIEVYIKALQIQGKTVILVGTDQDVIELIAVADQVPFLALGTALLLNGYKLLDNQGFIHSF